MATTTESSGDATTWLPLPLADSEDTRATLHMWTQVVGKVRLAQTPLVNHWWNVPLYVTARGLTTSVMPHGSRAFEMEFDFIDHALVIRTSEGATRALPLRPRAVADFYQDVMATLHGLDLGVEIHPTPVEVPDPIPFAEDRQHASYDREQAHRFWRVLLQVDRVLKEFRARFIGKCSPVHFFWGSFDLAVSRFSGRRAPVAADADVITREAYSHETSSAGWWPGSVGNVKEPAFFSYTAPQPEGLATAKIRPAGATYNTEMGIFILRYDDVRRADRPDETVLDFLQSTYEAGANLGRWDRAQLERTPLTP